MFLSIKYEPSKRFNKNEKHRLSGQLDFLLQQIVGKAND